jgi:hypothetical protein
MLAADESRAVLACVQPGLADGQRLRWLPAPSDSVDLVGWLRDLVEDPGAQWRSPWLRACAIHAARTHGVIDRFDLTPARARSDLIDEVLGRGPDRPVTRRGLTTGRRARQPADRRVGNPSRRPGTGTGHLRAVSGRPRAEALCPVVMYRSARSGPRVQLVTCAARSSTRRSIVPSGRPFDGPAVPQADPEIPPHRWSSRRASHAPWRSPLPDAGPRWLDLLDRRRSDPRVAWACR